MANPSTQTTNTLITATLWNELVNDIIAQTARGFSVVIDGGGAAITSDTFIDVGPMPIACTISSFTVQAYDCGDLTADVWKFTATVSDAPVASDTIFTAASDHIIMTCDRYLAYASPVGTMTLVAGDWLRFYVESCAVITKATIGVRLTQTFA
jgi:hypothetical protein